MIVENGPLSILDKGLAYDRCHIGVVTDMASIAGLENHDVQDMDQLYKVMRTQVDVVLSDGVAVLNADEPRLIEMASLCDGEVVLYTTAADHAAVHAHRAAGGRALLARADGIDLFNGQPAAGHVPLGSAAAQRVLSALQARHALDASQALQALMAAVASAWALGVPPELINAGLETFTPALTA